MISGADGDELVTLQKDIHIPFGDKIIESTISTQKKAAPTGGVILTHGAGGDMNTAELPQVANHLSELGFACARFTCKGLNLKYRVKVFKAVVEHFMKTEKWSWFIIGGRSMGARAAVSTANELFSDDDEPGKPDIKGVLCLSYPLHPPKDVNKLRDDILHSCKLPMFFVSGTEDVQCEKVLMENTLKNKTNVTMHWLEGGDHGLHVKGRDKLMTLGEICEVVGGWCKTMRHASSCITDDQQSVSVYTSDDSKTGKKRDKTTKLQDGSRRKRRKEKKD
ncbi:LOW QUALITY PROTEIN: testis-expressed protein 30-like [Amphiura filiformis]|uniref:LOW QUALITY PROTEIN: testis-expressed protein 30-like n=1 Tax=Amphiura filiformis TaxID=82378 RepID=UPI003B218F67